MYPLNRMSSAICGAVAIMTACASGAVLAQVETPTTLETPSVEVIGTTPVPGLPMSKDEVPANIQIESGERMEQQQSLNLPEFIEETMPSVYIQDIQNNPYQPNLTYRGFLSSPLLGTPQGLSVYQDGVRVNEPFGDIVNYDLIPQNAISTMTLIPGSNPIFGLNTLGGAIDIRTKRGASHPGIDATLSGGSWGRKQADIAYGGYNDKVDYFIAGNYFDEDGWRDFSPSKVGQLFGKIGWAGLSQPRLMSIKAFIIEADSNYRSLVAHHLGARWSGSTITEYDPEDSGRLPESFTGAGNDLVVLGDPLGDESGLDWLRQFKAAKNFPPVVVLGDGDERNIVAAIKAGAFDYISRQSINHENLIAICEAAMDSAEAAQESSSISANDSLEIPGLKGYQIERRISGGEIASVYLTQDKNGRDVVLKVLRQRTPNRNGPPDTRSGWPDWR